MSDVRRLVFSIVRFLGEQLQSSSLSADAKESLEVAVQCLENAYSMTQNDQNLAVSQSLLEIFSEAMRNEQPHPDAYREPTPQEKEEAERLKNKGNDLMRGEKYQEARDSYTKAISLDSQNAVFYCNRAAAYSKLDNHDAAIEDCKKALEIDSAYSKAYGRMGLAYSGKNQHREARDCYKRALDLEPDNESYQSNMKIAEEKLQQSSAAGGQTTGGYPGMGGGFDLNTLLSNPTLMNMATHMLSDPNMQHLMGNIISGNLSGGGGSGGTSGDINALLQAGQMLAQHMQSYNPDLVDQLRRQMGGGSSGQPDSDQPPSGGSSN